MLMPRNRPVIGNDALDQSVVEATCDAAGSPTASAVLSSPPMSTTSPQTSLQQFVPEPDDGALDPAEAFDALVLEEPDVCNACFSVIRRDHRKVEAGEHGHGKIAHDPYGETVVRVGDHAGDVELEADDVYGELATYPTRTVCGECGAFAGDGPPSTLSRREALERVARLAHRLQDHGLLVSERAMRKAVRHLKSQDEHAGRDMDVFRVAAALGITHGRGLAGSGSR